jgi:pseudaminic acid biosynthesis-associated methylase
MMTKMTEQMRKWMGQKGRDYTERNVNSVEGMDELYRNNYGVSRTELNQRFLEGMERSLPILEVGCNIGNQLLCLQKMGFNNLYGIDIERQALQIAKKSTGNIQILEGSVFEIPFPDEGFHIVFTSGLLIHIHPQDIGSALDEIHRCTKKYILGLEYYADDYTAIHYRGDRRFLWKTDFPRLYLEKFPDLKMVREERLRYLYNSNVDSFFMLAKY